MGIFGGVSWLCEKRGREYPFVPFMVTFNTPFIPFSVCSLTLMFGKPYVMSMHIVTADNSICTYA